MVACHSLSVQHHLYIMDGKHVNVACRCYGQGQQKRVPVVMVLACVREELSIV